MEVFPPRCIGKCPAYELWKAGILVQRGIILTRNCRGPEQGDGNEVAKSTVVDKDGYLGSEPGGPVNEGPVCTNAGMTYSLKELKDKYFGG